MQMPPATSRPSPIADGPGRRAAAMLVALVVAAGLCGCAPLRQLFPALPEWPATGAAPVPAGLVSSEAGEAAPVAASAPNADASQVAAAALLAEATAEPNDPSYRIGPEDALEISVWKDETLKGTVLVRPDGAISFPLVGELPAAGRTAAQVREEIARRLARFMPEPEVTVAVLRVASVRIYVIGRVNKPGDITVGRSIDVLQALSLAGGLTPFANEDEIRIIRRVNGRQVSLPFDYARVRRRGELSQNILLRSGDVLLVP